MECYSFTKCRHSQYMTRVTDIYNIITLSRIFSYENIFFDIEINFVTFTKIWFKMVLHLKKCNSPAFSSNPHHWCYFSLWQSAIYLNNAKNLLSKLNRYFLHYLSAWLNCYKNIVKMQISSFYLSTFVII